MEASKPAINNDKMILPIMIGFKTMMVWYDNRAAPGSELLNTIHPFQARHKVSASL